MKYYVTLSGIHKEYKTKITVGFEIDYTFLNDNKNDFTERCISEASNSNTESGHFEIVSIVESIDSNQESKYIFRNGQWIDPNLLLMGDDK
ncbi:MAG: hypothetical protein HOP30_11020 [Cyclobacteriaceae bacterium]|nr:hypothetical protein [Cyclobacteriaceae bacterium]